MCLARLACFEQIDEIAQLQPRGFLNLAEVHDEFRTRTLADSAAASGCRERFTYTSRSALTLLSSNHECRQRCRGSVLMARMLQGAWSEGETWRIHQEQREGAGNSLKVSFVDGEACWNMLNHCDNCCGVIIAEISYKLLSWSLKRFKGKGGLESRSSICQTLKVVSPFKTSTVDIGLIRV